jgi:hypothetical protein
MVLIWHIQIMLVFFFKWGTTQIDDIPLIKNIKMKHVAQVTP